MSLLSMIIVSLFAIILIVFGAYNGRHLFKKQNANGKSSQNATDKNNIPVVPRHLRNLDNSSPSGSKMTPSVTNDSRRPPRKSKADIFVKPASSSPSFSSQDDSPISFDEETGMHASNQVSNSGLGVNELSGDINNAFDDFGDFSDDFDEEIDISSIVIDDEPESQPQSQSQPIVTKPNDDAFTKQSMQSNHRENSNDFLNDMDDFLDGEISFDDSFDNDTPQFDDDINSDFDALFDDDNSGSQVHSSSKHSSSNAQDIFTKDSIDIDDTDDIFADNMDGDLTYNTDDVDISDMIIADTDNTDAEMQDDHNDDWLTDDDFAQSPVMSEEELNDVNVTTDSQININEQVINQADDDEDDFGIDVDDVVTDDDITASDTATNDDVESDAFYNLAFATERLMPTVKTVDEPEFTENSPVLDQHLLAHSDFDQNSPLKQAHDNLNITIIPLNEFSRISGKKLLKLIDDFGFKFGAMNMFHRYQNKDGSGVLWFSMMGLSKDGVIPFDLNTLPETTELKGLVLFLPLPHPKLLQGFDSMMSIAGLVARELEAFIVDEEGEPITREYKIQLRSHLQALEADLLEVSGF